MVQKREAVIGLIWIVSLHAVAIFLFTSGFFLTKYAVHNSSECNVQPNLHHFSKNSDYSSKDRSADEETNFGTVPEWRGPLLDGGFPGCWHQAPYRRALILIIDALRYDFILHNESLMGTQFYQNRLPFVRDLIKKAPNHGLAMRFIADPPTTTMQRIKGMTTGGMPTFFDFADNLDPGSSSEDNWIDQLVKAGKKTIFMGDDTWTMVYPNAFTTSFPYPSLVVKDIHTVDNGVLQHLYPTLNGTYGDWTLAIGHFLGVDHVGHSYGSGHPLMSEKLDQMNSEMERVLELIDDDTLLIVMGDHGMTPDGNHGVRLLSGASKEEVTAGLIAFSKRRPIHHDRPKNFDYSVLTVRSSSILPNSRYSVRHLRTASQCALNPHTQEASLRPIPQIDLVPSLSLLLGVPIPYGNLGTLIPEFFLEGCPILGAGTDGEKFISESISQECLPVYLRYVHLLRIVSTQQLNYLYHYSEHSRQFPVETIEYLQSSYNTLTKLHNKILITLPGKQTEISRNDFVAAIKLLEQFLRTQSDFHETLLDMCQKLWTTFNNGNMIKGVVIMALSIVAIILIVMHSHRENIVFVDRESFLSKSDPSSASLLRRNVLTRTLASSAAPLMPTSSLSLSRRRKIYQINWRMFVEALFICASGLALFLIYGSPDYLFYSSFLSVVMFIYRIGVPPNLRMNTYSGYSMIVVIVVILLLRFFSLNSNSYIETEPTTIYFYLLSLALYLTFASRQITLGVLLLLALKYSSYTSAGQHENFISLSGIQFHTCVSLPIGLIVYFSLSKPSHATLFASLCAGYVASFAVLGLDLNVVTRLVSLFLPTPLPILIVSKLLPSQYRPSPTTATLTAFSLFICGVYWTSLSLGLAADIHSLSSITYFFRVSLPRLIYYTTIANIIQLSLGTSLWKFISRLRGVPATDGGKYEEKLDIGYAHYVSHKYLQLLIASIPTFLLLLGPQSVSALSSFILSLCLFVALLKIVQQKRESQILNEEEQVAKPEAHKLDERILVQPSSTSLSPSSAASSRSETPTPAASRPPVSFLAKSHLPRIQNSTPPAPDTTSSVRNAMPNSRESKTTSTVSDDITNNNLDIQLIAFFALTVYLFSVYVFYHTGHTPDFSSIQFQTGFIGLDYFNRQVGGVLVAMNTFVGQILAALTLPLVDFLFNYYSLVRSARGDRGESHSRGSKETGEDERKRHEMIQLSQHEIAERRRIYLQRKIIFIGVFLFMCFNASALAVTMAFTGFNQRHLMVWRVFAPKFVFDGLCLLVTEFAFVAVAVFL